MVRKTKAEALETRDRIVDAAEQLFAVRGVARTTLQDVAVAAGVTRGAIYWHFSDKAALFDAMMQRVCLPCEAAAQAARTHAPSDALTTLYLLLLAPLEALASNPHIQRVFHIAMHTTEYTDEMQPVLERRLHSVGEYQRQLTEVLEQGRATGQVRPEVSAPAAALGLFALVDGLMHNWTLNPSQFDVLRVGQQAVGCYLQGIKTPTAKLTIRHLP